MNVIHKNVLVELVKVEDTVNGIYNPLSETKKNTLGKVVRYGEAIPESLKIVFSKSPIVEFKEFYTGGKVTVENVDYLVMNYKDILIIL